MSPSDNQNPVGHDAACDADDDAFVRRVNLLEILAEDRPETAPPPEGAARDGGAHTRALPHGRQRLRRSAREVFLPEVAGGGEPDGADGRVHFQDAAGKDDDDELGDDFRRSKTNDDRRRLRESVS